MNDEYNFITNNDIKKIGFWIRPDDLFSGIHYDKLVLQTKYKDDNMSWQTEDKMFSYEDLSTSTYVLTYYGNLSAWTIQASDVDCNIVKPQIDGPFDKSELMSYDNCGLITRKFMTSDMHSMLEESELYDISWTRLHDISELIFENYNGDDIVWRVLKCWSSDGHYSRANTVDLTIWLDLYDELSDGTLRWYQTETTYARSEDWKKWTPSQNITNIICRTKTDKPYQTCKWTAAIPSMFDFPSTIAALHNTKHLCLSYIANNPLKINYVFADAILRKTYEQMKLKEREWCVYNAYSPGNETVLYDDTYPHF